MVELKNVTLYFNKGTPDEKHALNDVSLKINDGDFITVIGSNGAGKTTLMNAISGTYMSDKGSIYIDGTDVTVMPEYKRAGFIGRLFQNPTLGTAPDMTIEENLALAIRDGRKYSFITKADRLKFKAILSRLNMGLENRLTAKVGLLSGGQRQALSLLMATASNPKILLLDEHTAALDPSTSKTVLALTDEIIGENKLTCLMITHNMQDALNHGNRTIMMIDGRIVYDVSGDERKNLTVKDLLEKFRQVSGDALANDRMLLS